MNENQFNVIQFLEAPPKQIAVHVCVPSSWVLTCGPFNPIAMVAYPDEDPLATERKVKKRNKKSDTWNSYTSIVKYKTDSYDNAIRYIQEVLGNEAKDNDDQLLKKISSQKQINKVVLPPEYDENDSRWTLKYREAAPGLVELMEHSGVYIDADKLAECKKQSNNCQTLAQMLLSEIFTANALSVCGLDNDFGIDRLHDGPGLDTHATVTLLKFVAEYGLEQDWEINDYDCMLKGIRKNLKILKTIETREGKYIEERGAHGKSTTILKHFHKRMFVPPIYPENDKNDSRWTLKFRQPAPGLVELMEHSGVYVNAVRLANCKRLSRDGKTLARMLLTEIFNRSALSTCSWTGARAKTFDQDGTNVRPGLDEQARMVLLNYVADRAKEEGWNNCENQTILKSMRNKMQKMRSKYQ